MYRRRGRTSGKVTKEGNLALAAKTKKFKKLCPQQKKGNKPQGKFFDVSKVECYNCHKFVHFARDCRKTKKKSKRRFQASATQIEEEEPKKKKNTKDNKEEEPRKEFYLISSLSSFFTNCATSWLVDSGASMHMIGNRGALTS